MTKISKTTNYQNLLGFIPSLIAEHFLQSERKVPDKQTIKTVVMFADISGFTLLSETLQKRGNEGSELLAFVLNRYMELLIKKIGRSGGDIFKFAGDAMIVLWPPPSSSSQEELETLCRQAVQSGLDIKNKLNDAVMFENKIKLSVKIGFGIGDVTIMHVGGEYNRTEYLPVGDPLTQAFECEHHATSGGQVIISQQVWNLMDPYFETKKLNDHSPSPNGPFYLLENLKSKSSAVKMKADSLLMRTNFNQGSIQAILDILESYIPKAVLPYIKIDQEKWSSELRRISVMFVNLGIDLSDAKSNEGLHKIQRIVKTVQKCLYQSEGSLNKILMDDKGSTLIVVFGLPPFAHQDDPVRAVLASFQLQQQLSKLNCNCSIGITTGLVFTGVVGTNGNRREYSVLGDTVNLSARLMQAACGEKVRKILVDEETKNEGEHKIAFKFFECRTVKGKTGQIPMYEPINPLKYSYLDEESMENFELRTHFFNVPSDLTMMDQYKDAFYILRREKEIECSLSLFEEFLRDEKNRLIFLKGFYGSGKSLFLRCLLSKLKERLKFKNENCSIKEQITVFISGFNHLSQKKKLNGWRKFLVYAIEKIRIKNNYKSHLEVLKDCAKEKDIPMIEDALDLDPQKSLAKEIEINKEMIGQFNLYIWMNFTEAIIYLLLEMKSVPPLLLFFEDLQNFDEESWDVLKCILNKDYNKLFIILSLRSDHLEAGIDVKTLTRNITEIKEILKKKIEKKLALKFVFQGLKPIDTLNIMKKFLNLNNIESNLLYFVHLKSRGNPIMIMSILRTLIKSNLIKKNLNKLIITNKANELFSINEFITVDAPQASIKLNSPIVDKLDSREILALKTASVIGDIFTSNILRKINPFKGQGISNEDLEKILTELENKEILNVLDEKDQKHKVYQFSHTFMREVIYQRMTYSQRRELHRIYAEILQNFTENTMNGRHEKFFEKLQSEKLIFHWKLAEGSSEMDTDVSDERINKCNLFSNSAKRSVIVQKICYMTIYKSLTALSTLKKGNLTYRLNNFIFWRQKFFVLSFKELKIYDKEDKDDNFKGDPDNFFACIPLKQIFEIGFVSEKQGESNTAILLQAGSFLKGKDNDEGLTQVYLSSADFDTIEEWAIYIEFARAKAIYDDFVIKFGKITFPLQKENKIIKKEKFTKQQRKTKFDSDVSSYYNPNPNVKKIKKENERLKELLKEFINKGFLLTLSNLALNAKPEKEKPPLGTENQFLKDFPSLFKVKPELLNKHILPSSLVINNTHLELKQKNNDEYLDNLGQNIKRKKSVSIDSKLIINRYETDEVITKKGSFKFEEDHREDIEFADENISVQTSEPVNCKSSYLSQNELERKISIMINRKVKRISQNISFDSTLTGENASSFDRLEQKRLSIQSASAKIPKQITNLYSSKQKEVEIKLNFEEVKNEAKIENSHLKLKINQFRMYKFVSDCFDDIIPFNVTSRKNGISKKCLTNKRRKLKIPFRRKEEISSEFIFIERDTSVSGIQKGRNMKERIDENHSYKKNYGITLKEVKPLNIPEINVPKDELLIINELKVHSEILNCTWNNTYVDIYSRDIKVLNQT